MMSETTRQVTNTLPSAKKIRCGRPCSIRFRAYDTPPGMPRRLAAGRRGGAVTIGRGCSGMPQPGSKDDLCDFRSALARERVLPELLPASLRGPPHVHDEAAHRAVPP